jgi:transcriptional regulator with XRE-family HTH domain
MKNLRKFRKEKKLTQKRLAQILGINVISIVRWERGYSSPSADLIPKIARALEIPVAQLFEGP